MKAEMNLETKLNNISRMYQTSQEHINKLNKIIYQRNLKIIEKNESLINYINDEKEIKKLKSENNLAQKWIANYLNREEVVKAKKEEKINNALKFKKNLAQYNNTTQTFYAWFSREGIRRNDDESFKKTCLFKEIKLAGQNKLITDHIWTDMTDEIQKMNLKHGNKIKMQATVKKYNKIGYNPYESKIDTSTVHYSLVDICNVERI